MTLHFNCLNFHPYLLSFDRVLLCYLKQYLSFNWNAVSLAKLLKWIFKTQTIVCMHAKSFHLCLTLCDPMDSSLPGSSIHGIFQSRMLEWVPWPSLWYFRKLGITFVSLMSSALAGGFFITSASTIWQIGHRRHGDLGGTYYCISSVMVT